MSRFIDELNRVARVTVQPMGFGASRAASSGPRMLLAVSMAGGDEAAGADAVLLRQEKSALTAAALKKAVDALPGVPWGGLADVDAKRTAVLVDAGCDFLVFTAESTVLSAPEDDKVGRVLQVAAALDDSLLRAVNDLPVDAVLAAGEDEADAIAWKNLMQIQRLSNLLSKPLLVTASVKITGAEVRALWEAGVDGVVVGDGATPEELEELRRLIDGLPPRSARRRGKNDALVPRIGTGASPAADEEDDDWDDE